MIVNHDDSPTPPACWNREPGPASYTRYGIDQHSGERIEVEIRMDWGSPECATWHGTGIGPKSERYPEAYGWRQWCLQCRRMPEQYR